MFLVQMDTMKCHYCLQESASVVICAIKSWAWQNLTPLHLYVSDTKYHLQPKLRFCLFRHSTLEWDCKCPQMQKNQGE